MLQLIDSLSGSYTNFQILIFQLMIHIFESTLISSLTVFPWTTLCFRNLNITCFSSCSIDWCKMWIKGASVWNSCRNWSNTGFKDSRNYSWTIVSGDVRKLIILPYLSLPLIFLSASGNFLKYSNRARNWFFTLSVAGNSENHLDSTCLRNTTSSRSSFCWIFRKSSLLAADYLNK